MISISQVLFLSVYHMPIPTIGGAKLNISFRSPTPFRDLRPVSVNGGIESVS